MHVFDVSSVAAASISAHKVSVIADFYSDSESVPTNFNAVFGVGGAVWFVASSSFDAIVGSGGTSSFADPARLDF